MYISGYMFTVNSKHRVLVEDKEVVLYPHRFLAWNPITDEVAQQIGQQARARLRDSGLSYKVYVGVSCHCMLT